MTADIAPSGILAGLERLITASDVPATQRDMARRLSDRLGAPVHVCICCAMPEVGQFVKAGLDGAGLSTSALINLTVSAVIPDTVDIVVWPTFVFDASEVARWSSVPDTLKDRSFLVSLVPDAGGLANTLSDLHLRAAADFDTVLAISMQDSADAFADLARRLSRRVRDGRAADIDAALLMMDRLKDVVTDLPQAPALQPVAAPAPTVQPPVAAPDVSSALHKAEALLQAHAAALQDTPISANKDAIAWVLQSCAKTSDTLCDLLAQSDCADIYADAMLAQDDIILMSLEENLTSAVDAVTTLLHLRRDLQCELAS